MHRTTLLGALALATAACVVEQPVSDDDDGSSSNAGGGAATAGTGGSTAAGDSTTGAGAGPATGPETSAQSLARQQQLHGWGPENCPTGMLGTAIGDQIEPLTLFDCDGNPVEINQFCGADAGWFFFAHGW